MWIGLFLDDMSCCILKKFSSGAWLIAQDAYDCAVITQEGECAPPCAGVRMKMRMRGLCVGKEFSS